MNNCKTVFVDLSALPTKTEGIYSKLYTIFKTRVEERCGASILEGTHADNGFSVRFELDGAMADESYDISDTVNGVVIKGKNFPALMFGLGRLLHSSKYSSEGIEISEWRGYSVPDCDFRVIYFAAHFYNWYQNTCIEDLTKYFEDLMLWGYNGICAVNGKINMDGPDDPKYERAIRFAETLMATAKSLGMKTATIFSNIDFKIKNEAVAADMSGVACKTGNATCPACEGGYEYLLKGAMLNMPRYAKIGLDYIIFFPYDEGGCSCEMCAPWGGNGFYRMSKRIFHDLKKEACPDAKAILATWHFNFTINDKRDFPWLDRAIREDKALGNDWVSYIMLETRNGIPDYIKEHGIPGGCRAVDFPEITMLKADPWGGYGAVCTPDYINGIWGKVGPLVSGGMPYSEGIFDDLNKAHMVSLLWDKQRSSLDVFRDYCGYEFKEEIAEDLLEMCRIFEKNQFITHVSKKQPADVAAAAKAKELAEKIDASLPENIRTKWQWRLFYIRAMLDYERYSSAEAAGWDYKPLVSATRFEFWGQYMTSPEAKKLLLELLDIYKMPEKYDPDVHFGHFMVRPPTV